MMDNTSTRTIPTVSCSHPIARAFPTQPQLFSFASFVDSPELLLLRRVSRWFLEHLSFAKPWCGREFALLIAPENALIRLTIYLPQSPLRYAALMIQLEDQGEQVEPLVSIPFNRCLTLDQVLTLLLSVPGMTGLDVSRWQPMLETEGGPKDTNWCNYFTHNSFQYLRYLMCWIQPETRSTNFGHLPPSLRHLSLSTADRFHGISVELLAAVSATPLTQLHTLELRVGDIPLSHQHWRYMAQLGNLRRLGLSASYSSPAAMGSLVGHMVEAGFGQDLEVLELVGYYWLQLQDGDALERATLPDHPTHICVCSTCGRFLTAAHGCASPTIDSDLGTKLSSDPQKAAGFRAPLPNLRVFSLVTAEPWRSEPQWHAAAAAQVWSFLRGSYQLRLVSLAPINKSRSTESIREHWFPFIGEFLRQAPPPYVSSSSYAAGTSAALTGRLLAPSHEITAHPQRPSAAVLPNESFHIRLAIRSRHEQLRVPCDLPLESEIERLTRLRRDLPESMCSRVLLSLDRPAALWWSMLLF